MNDYIKVRIFCHSSWVASKFKLGVDALLVFGVGEYRKTVRKNKKKYPKICKVCEVILFITIKRGKIDIHGMRFDRP